MYNAIIKIFVLSAFSLSCENLDPKDYPNLKSLTLIEGKKGRRVQSSDTVKVHYKGFFTDGRMFDSSHKRKKPKRFPMRSTTVIKGWKVGILGMKVGEKRKLTIPPELAFGDKGKMGRIPPNATLIFEIELLEIE